MKIIFFVYNFPPKWLAGTELSTYSIAEYIAKRGHEVHIITSLDPGLPKHSSEKNFFIHRLLYYSFPFLGSQLFRLFVIREILKINPDIIHVQAIFASIPIILIKVLFNYPLVIYARGSDVYLPSHLSKITRKILLKKADRVIALTEHMKDTIQEFYSDKIVVIPNGVDSRFFSSETVKTEKDLLVRELLFVGRLDPVKGISFLLHAVALIKKKYPDVHLTIIGDGKEKKTLLKLIERLNISNNIIFLGAISHERIHYHMNRSKIFILPSLSEGFPLAILEAMAAGLPIIASSIGGIIEIIDDGLNGFLVEPKNPEDIAEKVIYLFQNEHIWQKISLNCRKKAGDYSWNSVVESLIEIYEDIVYSTKN